MTKQYIAENEMNPSRREFMGLEKSIKYFEDILYHNTKDYGDGIGDSYKKKEFTRGFPLCRKYHVLPHNDKESISVCLGCPVCQDTGKIRCENTAYDDWCKHQICVHDAQIPFSIQCPDCKKMIQRFTNHLRVLWNERIQAGISAYKDSTRCRIDPSYYLEPDYRVMPDEDEIRDAHKALGGLIAQLRI